MDDPLMLDANAVAGDLHELFGVELTAVLHQCAYCGNRGAVGTLRAWTRGPGTVLRCSVCSDVVLRWSRTSGGTVLDLRGAALIELPRL
ncbi:MAG: DUF6510 family protein [Chloroflexota bacterium]|nr:DUF6510 family protein [Chloroflexota bacterium]